MNASEAAARAVRAWTRIYSLGLPREVREARRAELESDLWEHMAEAATLGVSDAETARQVLGRMLRGMGADVSWRLQRGGIAVGSMRGIERTSGLVMLLVVLAMFGAVSGPGLSGEDPYFTQDFPALAAQPGAHARALAFQFAVGVGMVAAAALLYRTFRAELRAAAVFGSAALAVAGMMFVAGAGTGVWLLGLAGDWRESGVAGDATWERAQTVARITEYLSFFALPVFALSFSAFGLTAARRGLLPRGLGWLVATGAVLVLTAFVVFGVWGDAGWFLLMFATLVVLVSFVLMAAWLVLRGTARPNAPPPSVL